ncbi:MAG TPA: DUF3307 domain-containing protein [Gammaproteobacteria bacterium]|nr:DUF3307 domain-containing protein [Gammaproteobacteria bacterium]
MIATLITLLTGHALGDFVFQTGTMVARKRSPSILLAHVAVVTAITAAALGTLHWPVLVAICLSHAAMDAVKAYALRATAGAFLLDQSVHVAVIVALAIAYPTATAHGVWPAWLGAAAYVDLLRAEVIAVGLIAAVLAGGILIGMLMEPLAAQLEESQSPAGGLDNGGRYIGWLERAVVMLLFLSGQGGAVGFVIAAKSILRFGEINSAAQRRLAEYILIGTFMSFGWSLLCAMLTSRGLAAAGAGP